MVGRTRRWIAGAVAVVAVAGVGTATLRAQAGNPLDVIMSSVARILELLDPAPGAVTLSTPTVRVLADELVTCTLTNIGTETIAPLDWAVLDQEGQSQGSGLSTFVAPGQTRGGGIGGFAGQRRCEFSFHGTPSTVRASLSISESQGRTRLVVDAR